MWLLKQHFQIESARFLPFLPSTHPCARMHGHSFKIILSIKGDIDPQLGWVMDYNEIQSRVNPVLQLIDHQELNKVPGLENPTTEILTRWIYERLLGVLPGLVCVSVCETASTECHYPF